MDYIYDNKLDYNNNHIDFLQFGLNNIQFHIRYNPLYIHISLYIFYNYQGNSNKIFDHNYLNNNHCQFQLNNIFHYTQDIYQFFLVLYYNFYINYHFQKYNFVNIFLRLIYTHHNMKYSLD